MGHQLQSCWSKKDLRFSDITFLFSQLLKHFSLWSLILSCVWLTHSAHYLIIMRDKGTHLSLDVWWRILHPAETKFARNLPPCCYGWERLPWERTAPSNTSLLVSWEQMNVLTLFWSIWCCAFHPLKVSVFPQQAYEANDAQTSLKKLKLICKLTEKKKIAFCIKEQQWQA